MCWGKEGVIEDWGFWFVRLDVLLIRVGLCYGLGWKCWGVWWIVIGIYIFFLYVNICFGINFKIDVGGIMLFYFILS